MLPIPCFCGTKLKRRDGEDGRIECVGCAQLWLVLDEESNELRLR